MKKARRVIIYFRVWQLQLDFRSLNVPRISGRELETRPGRRGGSGFHRQDQPVQKKYFYIHKHM